MALEDFLQEYVAEVEEHIQELEQSLLTLEREGANIEEMAQIFRAAHSIKGASAYMGFEGLAGLTHDMESFISQIQSGSRSGTKTELNALFQCVDFLRGALGLLQKKGQEPPVPSALFTLLKGEEIVKEPESGAEDTGEYDFLFPSSVSPPDDVEDMDISLFIMPDEDHIRTPMPAEGALVEKADDFSRDEEEILEEDQELFSIFVTNFRENFLELARLLADTAATRITPEVFEKAQNLTKRLASSSQYMDYERVVQIVREWESTLSTFRSRGDGDGPQLFRFLTDCGHRLQRALPSLDLDLDLTFSTDEEPDAAELSSPESIQEEDEELFQIFVHSFQECFHELIQIASAPEASVTPEELESAGIITRRMISSALYMDYEQIVKVLEEWQNSLSSSTEEGALLRSHFRAFLQDFGRQLRRFLPQLDVTLAGPPTQVLPQPIETFDEEDEELFGIFSEAFRQNYSEIAGYAPSSADVALFGMDALPARQALARMISSSRYMGYDSLANVLTEWDEALEAASQTGAMSEEEFRSLLTAYTERLQALAPAQILSLAVDAGETTSTAAEESSQGFEPALDDFISSILAPAEAPPPLQPQPSFPAAPPAPSKSQSAKADTTKTAVKKEGGPSSAEAEKTDTAPTATTLRVDAQKVDQLLNEVGELVVNRSEFAQMVNNLRSLVRELASQGKIIGDDLRRLRTISLQLNESTTTLGRVTGSLQSTVMRVRMLPISQLFQRFPRIVRDQALKLGKKVDLILEGADTEVDRRVLEQMYDPIVQFLRNCVAHGIERPEVRLAAGKSETGTIRLAAYHVGDFVTLEVEDDGRGIDTEKLRQVLVSKDRLSAKEVERFSEEEISQAIFWPGISTHGLVDGSAGRGVGLDVVKENVERMGGTVDLESQRGQGTRFVIRLPLTVAIIRALLVEEREQIYSLPLGSVTEIVRLEKENLYNLEDFTVLTVRDRTIPVFSLRQLVGTNGTQAHPDMVEDALPDRHRFVVIVSSSFQEVGLLVDTLYGEQEVVVKPVESDVHSLEGFSGATILGDGTISLVLDVSALLRTMQTRIKSTSIMPHGTAVN